jgi:hypothetical protein
VLSAFYIDILGVANSAMTPVSSSRWRAAAGCPEHLRDTLEKVVNSFPPEWLEAPATGEIYESMEEANGRLNSFSLSQGFDVVISRSTQTPQPVTTFSCIHHGHETRNWRKLPPTVERDETGAIIGERKQNFTGVQQTDCPWACRVSYKSLGKRGSSKKGFVLTVKSVSHDNTHPLASNPFVYKRHKDRLPEYQMLKAQAQSHRTAVLPYSLSRQVLDVGDGSGLSLSRREYYNLKRQAVLSSKDEKTIDGLLFALDDAGFVHRCRIEDQMNDSGTTVSRKLIQIWFTLRTLIETSALFVAGSVCVIDATFNTNKARMPIIVAVGILTNGKTFPVAFSYCRAEDHESYAFFWESLKEHWPIGTALPSVVISDQASAILSSLIEQFPGVKH